MIGFVCGVWWKEVDIVFRCCMWIECDCEMLGSILVVLGYRVLCVSVRVLFERALTVSVLVSGSEIENKNKKLDAAFSFYLFIWTF